MIRWNAWPSCCGPTRNRPSSAVTSPASNRRPPSRSASTTSGTPRPHPRRGPGLLPGALLPGLLLPPLPRRASHRGSTAPLPAGGRWRGPVVVSAPLADARFLAVPDRVDGPRAADGDLPGTVPEVSRPSWPGRDRGPQGLGVPRRRRNGRAGVARGDLPGRARAARQPDLRRQLQPPAPRRARPRQRQDHPGTRVRLPRCRVEVIKVVWGARWDPLIARTPAGSCSSAWRSASTASIRTSSPRSAVKAASTSRQEPRDEGDRRRHDRRADLEPQPGGHDPNKILPPTRWRSQHKGQPP